MADVTEVTKSLDDVALTPTENEGAFNSIGVVDVLESLLMTDLVQPSVVLESFTESLLKYRDPVMREAFLESTLEVLKPRGDEQDAGRVRSSSTVWSSNLRS
jgi:hypothetical protein